MHTRACKLSDKKVTGREITVQLRQADNHDDQLELCGLSVHGDEARAEKAANATFNGYYSVKWQAAKRGVLSEASEEDLPRIIQEIQDEAAAGWTFDGGRERKPKAPKEVAIEEKESYSPEELKAILAKVGARAIVTE